MKLTYFSKGAPPIYMARDYKTIQQASMKHTPASFGGPLDVKECIYFHLGFLCIHLCKSRPPLETRIYYLFNHYLRKWLETGFLLGNQIYYIKRWCSCTVEFIMLLEWSSFINNICPKHECWHFCGNGRSPLSRNM